MNTKAPLPTPLKLSLASGLSISGLRWGNRGGQHALALHGWLDNAATFDGLAPLLPELDLVAVDLPGHGKSDWRNPGADYHYVSWVADVIEILDALGWDEVILIGHSMSAGVTAMTASIAPERVLKVVMLEGIGAQTSPPEDAPKLLAKGIIDRTRLAGRVAKIYSNTDELAARRRAGAREKILLSSAKRLIERGAKAVDGGVVMRHDPRLRGSSLMRLTEEHVRSFFRQVACPALMVRANDGWKINPEMVKARLGDLRHKTVVEVEGMHHVHLDAPARVAPAVRSFLGLDA